MRLFYLLAGWLLALPVLAASNVNAHVLYVRVDVDGRGVVTFDSTIVGTPPACVISYYNNAFAFDSNTAGGKAILATVLSAKASGSLVSVYGTGACAIYGVSVEDWGSGSMYN